MVIPLRFSLKYSTALHHGIQYSRLYSCTGLIFCGLVKKDCQWLNFHAAYDSAHALPIIVTIRDLEIHGL